MTLKNAWLLFAAIALTSCSSIKNISDKEDRGLSMSIRTSPSKKAKELLKGMSLEEKIAQLFIIAPESLASNATSAITEEFCDELKKYPVGGFILFGYHIKNPEQLKTFTSQLKKACSLAPIIAVDEEGGRVARLAESDNFSLPKFKSMEAVGSSLDPENARKAGQTIGNYLLDYGFTMDFAPVADINTNPQNIIIGDRAFGNNAELVTSMVEAFLFGLKSSGIKGCIKHFPGHGDTKDDTHSDYVAVTKTWKELKKCELIPFKKNLPYADSVMLAHITLTKITKDGLPASLSKELITGKLRKELGYKGVILTDALNMGAIEKNYEAGEAAVLAFEAGNDILLMPSHFRKAYTALLNAVKNGRISERRVNQSVLRILTLKDF
ncbi:MAG: glycoside hydrolase family 3 protein [Treponema sp.]|nr:glycoside hydrolase family 3 protein [Treponema sp.]